MKKIYLEVKKLVFGRVKQKNTDFETQMYSVQTYFIYFLFYFIYYWNN